MKTSLLASALAMAFCSQIALADTIQSYDFYDNAGSIPLNASGLSNQDATFASAQAISGYGYDSGSPFAGYELSKGSPYSIIFNTPASTFDFEFQNLYTMRQVWDSEAYGGQHAWAFGEPLEGLVSARYYNIEGTQMHPYNDKSYVADESDVSTLLSRVELVVNAEAAANFMTKYDNYVFRVDNIPLYLTKVSFTPVDALRPVTPPVPEPETYAMLLSGLGLLGFIGRRRKANKT